MDDVAEKLGDVTLEEQPESSENDQDSLQQDASDSEGSVEVEQIPDKTGLEPLDVEIQPLQDDAHVSPGSTNAPPSNSTSPPIPVYDDPSDSDDGEGEWITPGNVSLHKSRALDLLPAAGAGTRKNEVIGAGCMTADFAMQNVLLQMGLTLVGVEGKRIEKVKSWVLRCHACFKYVSALAVAELIDSNVVKQNLQGLFQEVLSIVRKCDATARISNDRFPPCFIRCARDASAPEAEFPVQDSGDQVLDPRS